MTSDSWASFPDELRRHCETFGLAVNEQCLSLCVEHLQVLVRWNRKMNLVGDLSLATAIHRHYAESLFLASLLPKQPLTIADIGSGAGFPGAIVAASIPQSEVYLVESRQKRAVFLRESTRGWPNCHVFHGVAEDIDFSIDFLTTRAVAVDLLTDLAARHTASLGMLVSAVAAREVAGTLEALGYRCECFSVPWRPTAAALVGLTPLFHVERSM